MNEQNTLCRLPLKDEQLVEFSESGQVVLCLEGPQLSRRFSGLSFELTADDGSPLPGRRSFFRLRSSGISRTRMTYRVYTIPHPGEYALLTSGLGDTQPTDADHNLVFVRPYLLTAVACILGILFGAFLTIGSLVNLLLRLAQERGGGSA